MSFSLKYLLSLNTYGSNKKVLLLILALSGFLLQCLDLHFPKDRVKAEENFQNLSVKVAGFGEKYPVKGSPKKAAGNGTGSGCMKKPAAKKAKLDGIPNMTLEMVAVEKKLKLMASTVPLHVTAEL